MYHKNLTGADLHYARAIVGSGTPVASVSASISGELYLNKTTQDFWAAGTAGTSYWNLLGGVKIHSALTNLMYASSGHTGFASSGHLHQHQTNTNLSYASSGHLGFSSTMHTHAGVYSTTAHTHLYSTLTGLPLIRSYTGTSPITVAGSTVSISKAASGADGYLSSTDWTTFNNKQIAGTYATAGHLHAGVYSTTAHTHTSYAIVHMEDRRGTGCTGTTGNQSRFLALNSLGVLKNAQMIALNGGWLHDGDYVLLNTPIATAGITFLPPVWDEDYIRIIYFT